MSQQSEDTTKAIIGEVDKLNPGELAEYVWHGINLPHKLVVRIVGGSEMIVRCLEITRPMQKQNLLQGFKQLVHKDDQRS